MFTPNSIGCKKILSSDRIVFSYSKCNKDIMLRRFTYKNKLKKIYKPYQTEETNVDNYECKNLFQLNKEVERG